MARARAAGGLRQDVTLADVLDLVSARSRLTEQGRRDTADDRLLDLVLDGVRPPPAGG